MSRFPGPPSVPSGPPLSSVGVYSPSGMPTHMPSPQTGPYNVAVQSPSQYGQQPGPSPNPGHYSHQSTQPVMVGPPGGYGQPMMHGMMQTAPSQQPQPQVSVPPQQAPTVVQQPTPQQAPQQQTMQQAPQQAPQAAQDDLGARVKRAYVLFENNLKGFLHDYSSILQMDDARLNSQNPEHLVQISQNLVRRYESLLVTLDLFESNLRMLQDYNSTQSDFRRVVNLSASDRRPIGGQGDTGQYPGVHPLARQMEPNHYQLFLSRMQTQIGLFKDIREIGKKFLESSSTQQTSMNK